MKIQGRRTATFDLQWFLYDNYIRYSMQIGIHSGPVGEDGKGILATS